jgi:hypothetical protein
MSATIKLVSLGSGREIEVPDNATVADVRKIAGVSDDLELRFNGETVSDEGSTRVSQGDTVSAAAPSVKHGAEKVRFVIRVAS